MARGTGSDRQTCNAQDDGVPSYVIATANWASSGQIMRTFVDGPKIIKNVTYWCRWNDNGPRLGNERNNAARSGHSKNEETRAFKRKSNRNVPESRRSLVLRLTVFVYTIDISICCYCCCRTPLPKHEKSRTHEIMYSPDAKRSMSGVRVDPSNGLHETFSGQSAASHTNANLIHVNSHSVAALIDTSR